MGDNGVGVRVLGEGAVVSGLDRDSEVAASISSDSWRVVVRRVSSSYTGNNGGCYSLARIVDPGSQRLHLGFPALVCVAGDVRTFDAHGRGCDLGEGASVPSY